VLFFFMALLAIKTPMMRRKLSVSIGAAESLRMKTLASDPGHWGVKRELAKAEGSIPKDADTEDLRSLIFSDAFDIGLSVPGHM